MIWFNIVRLGPRGNQQISFGLSCYIQSNELVSTVNAAFSSKMYPFQDILINQNDVLILIVFSYTLSSTSFCVFNPK